MSEMTRRLRLGVPRFGPYANDLNVGSALTTPYRPELGSDCSHLRCGCSMPVPSFVVLSVPVLELPRSSAPATRWPISPLRGQCPASCTSAAATSALVTYRPIKNSPDPISETLKLLDLAAFNRNLPLNVEICASCGIAMSVKSGE